MFRSTSVIVYDHVSGSNDEATGKKTAVWTRNPGTQLTLQVLFQVLLMVANGVYENYHLAMTNIAMENLLQMVLAGKIIYYIL